jgi:hypothetical protein
VAGDLGRDQPDHKDRHTTCERDRHPQRRVPVEEEGCRCKRDRGERGMLRVVDGRFAAVRDLHTVARGDAVRRSRVPGLVE